MIELVWEESLQDFPVELVWEESLQDFPVKLVWEESLQDFPVMLVWEDSLRKLRRIYTRDPVVLRSYLDHTRACRVNKLEFQLNSFYQRLLPAARRRSVI